MIGSRISSDSRRSQPDDESNENSDEFDEFDELDDDEDDAGCETKVSLDEELPAYTFAKEKFTKFEKFIVGFLNWLEIFTTLPSWFFKPVSKR